MTRLTDAEDLAHRRLHALVAETQAAPGSRCRRSSATGSPGGSPAAPVAPRSSRRGAEAELLASGMLVIEGDRSFYLFTGSRREERGEPKRFASYALQWAMMRHARPRGARVHDLWGVAPPDAGPDHPWHGVGLFKKGFGGREVMWAGPGTSSWIRPCTACGAATAHRLRTAPPPATDCADEHGRAWPG